MILSSTRGYTGGLVGLLIVLFTMVGVLAGPLVWRVPSDIQDLSVALQPPTGGHPFGTDQMGRDLLSRVIHGGRVSILIGLASVMIGMSVGVALGIAAAVCGSIVEAVCMRLVDALLALPGIVQAVIFVAVIGRGISPLIVALGLYSTPIFARVAYSATRQVISQDYIEAARALGAVTSRIIFRHILPNIGAPLLTIATLRIGANILTGAALNFFGLGIQPPSPEWGLMIAEARSYSWSNPHLIVYPGLSLFFVSLGFNFLGDALRDWFDPRLARQG